MKKMPTKKNKSIRPDFFAGVITALITPFYKGKVDYKSLQKLVQKQLSGGVQGFVVNGTTAESPTLSFEEIEKIFKLVKNEVGHNFPLILGTGSNSTAETIKKTKQASKLGASAALVVVPYYNKPPQRGLVAHYRAVAKDAKVPVLLYNVPGRTVISMQPETVIELSKIKNIIGIKEASGNINCLTSMQAGIAHRPFLFSSGDDSTCIEFILRGGHGVVSVISHVIPRQLRELSDRARGGDTTAMKDYAKFQNLNRLLGIEANPIPVKAMLYEMGIIRSPELRLPLVSLAKEHAPAVNAELKQLGLI
jgi:4-hydroxy-tetrahydrodipicolinate synthase